MAPLICPECNGSNVNRSRRRSLLDYLLAMFGYFPYRCSTCLHRFREWGNVYSGSRDSESSD